MEVSLGAEGMLDMYLYESFQLLEQVEVIALLGDEEGFYDKESIDEIFRVMHTIKGSAGIMMYDNISLVAHKLEDIFYYLRETFCGAVPKKELNEYVLNVYDFITDEFNKIKEGKNADGDPSSLIKEIESFVKVIKKDIEKEGYHLPPENKYEPPMQYYIAPVANQEEPLKIDLGLARESLDKEADYIVGIPMSKLSKLAELVEKMLTEEANCLEEVDWIVKKGKLAKIAMELHDAIYDMRKTSLENMMRKMYRVVYDISKKTGKSMELEISGQNLEVDRDIVESISSALLHLVRNAADHGIEEKKERAAKGKDPKGNIVIAAKIEGNLLFVSISDDGKGLDADEIYEKAKERQLIDNQKGRQEYTEEEIYQFITYPGFSTSRKVSEFSGRGVGVDAAVKKIRKIGGVMKIESTYGKETVMTMEIPLS